LRGGRSTESHEQAGSYSTRLGNKLVDGEGPRVVIRRLFLPDGDLFMSAALKPSRRARLASEAPAVWESWALVRWTKDYDLAPSSLSFANIKYISELLFNRARFSAAAAVPPALEHHAPVFQGKCNLLKPFLNFCGRGEAGITQNDELCENFQVDGPKGSWAGLNVLLARFEHSAPDGRSAQDALQEELAQQRMAAAIPNGST
jgi:hypothetical protein